MNETKSLDWNKTRDFDIERTNIFISFIFEILFVVLPYMVIWVLVGSTWNNDKFHNYYNNLPIKELSLSIICFSSIIFSFICNYISYLFKLQKEDSFTYTISIALAIFGLIVNSIWIDKIDLNGFAWLLRIVFLIIFAIIGIFIGTFFTMLIRNHRFKIEEEDQLLLTAYRNGEQIPSIKMIRVERAEKYRIRKEKELAELKEFKDDLDNRISIEMQELKLKKQIDKQSKMDLKEEKQKQKKSKK